jgi:hypothetical protein
MATPTRASGGTRRGCRAASRIWPTYAHSVPTAKRRPAAEIPPPAPQPASTAKTTPTTAATIALYARSGSRSSRRRRSKIAIGIGPV